MARRAGYGSLTAYSNSIYDFTTAPVKDGEIKAEHGQKTIDLLLQVKDQGDLRFVNQGELIPSSLESSLLNYVNNLAAEPIEGNQSSCRGACTGLCYGTCTGGCGGCAGTCTAGCQGCQGCGGCTDTCNGCTSCTGQCSGCTSCTAGATR
jgi:hypothetical protein